LFTTPFSNPIIFILDEKAKFDEDLPNNEADPDTLIWMKVTLFMLHQLQTSLYVIILPSMQLTCEHKIVFNTFPTIFLISDSYHGGGK
jgi:hypothetical protein